MKTMILTTGLLSLASMIAHGGEQNLPEVSAISDTGRVKVFPSTRGTQWFLPLALESSLDCSPESTTKRSCILRIQNALSPSEEAALQQLQDRYGRVDFFRDIDTRIVKGVEEGFVNLSTTVQSGEPMLLKSLALSPTTPYASVQFRGSSERIVALIQEYETEGLGEFVSEVQFNGEYTLARIVVSRTADLQKFLNRALTTPVTRKQVKEMVEELVVSSALRSVGYTQGEVEVITAEYIRQQFLRYVRRGKYRADSTKLAELGTELVVTEDSEAPVSMSCKVRLRLQKGAIQTARCQEVE